MPSNLNKSKSAKQHHPEDFPGRWLDARFDSEDISGEESVSKDRRRGHSSGDDAAAASERRAYCRTLAKMYAAKFIQSAREYANPRVTQEELAHRLGVSKGYISQVESLTSDKKVPLDFLIEVAEVTGFDFVSNFLKQSEGGNALTPDLILGLADVEAEASPKKRK